MARGSLFEFKEVCQESQRDRGFFRNIPHTIFSKVFRKILLNEKGLREDLKEWPAENCISRASQMAESSILVYAVVIIDRL